MNWRRGLLRAWMVLSAIWIVAYLALACPDQLIPTLALSSESGSATQAASDAIARHMNIDPPPRGFYLDDLTRIGRNVQKMHDQNAPETDIDTYLRSEGLAKREFTRYEAEQLRSELIDEAHRRFWTHLGFLLGIPFGLLVVSTSMFWVVRGFRSA